MPTARSGDPCRCRDCPCKNITRERGWQQCRPCAIGNHWGGICGTPTAHQWMKMPECIICGYDLIEHQSARQDAPTAHAVATM